MLKTILLAIFAAIAILFVIGVILCVFWLGITALGLLCKITIPLVLIALIIFILGVLFGEL